MLLHFYGIVSVHELTCTSANLSKTCKYTAVWHHDRGSVGKKPSLVVTFRASYQTKEYKSGPVIEEDNHALAEWAEDLVFRPCYMPKDMADRVI